MHRDPPISISTCRSPLRYYPDAATVDEMKTSNEATNKARPLTVKTAVKAGGRYVNHSAPKLVVKTAVYNQSAPRLAVR